MARLAFVHALRIGIGAPQERLIRLGIVISNQCDQVVGV
jgi:hypothetical protein